MTRSEEEPRDTKDTEAKTDERPALTDRISDMDGGHIATCVGAGTISNILSVVAVGQGWMEPKTTAGLAMGLGSATATAGWLWNADHVMAAGVGVTAAGAFSLSNQLAVDAYESVEERARQKRKEREEKDNQKQIAEMRALLTGAAKPRNGRRLVVISEDGEVIEDPTADIS